MEDISKRGKGKKAEKPTLVQQYEQNLKNLELVRGLMHFEQCWSEPAVFCISLNLNNEPSAQNTHKSLPNYYIIKHESERGQRNHGCRHLHQLKLPRW